MIVAKVTPAKYQSQDPRMASLTESYGEDPWSGNSDLSEVTASEYLLYRSQKVPYDAWLRMGPGDSSASLSLEPRRSYLPEASAFIKPDATTSGLSSGLSVGSDALRYSRVATERPQNQGTVVRDTFEGGIGPFKGFFMKETDPRDQGRRTRKFGGSANVGPVTLYGEREDTTRTVIPEQDRRFFTNPDEDVTQRVFGVRGSLPMGPGTLSADLSRRLSGVRDPQFFLQQQRPGRRNPNVTELRGGYEGRVGPGILGLTGRLKGTRGMGTGNEAGVSYNVDDPFGLGGRFSAQGSYGNIGTRPTAQGSLRYLLPF